MNQCLINQSACGRIQGDPGCTKCGMDERVVYPGQADREAAQERAELRFLRAHVKELEGRSPPPPTPPKLTKAIGEVFRDAPWAPEMVLMPSGRFLMGSPESELGRTSDEGPQHEVTIGYGLSMGKYPVTFEEWDACVAYGGTSHKPSDSGWGRGRRPVINVSWDDAQQYLAWLNQKLGLVANDPTRYRLPSEAEWEYACRAGSAGMYSTPDGLIDDERANYDATYRFAGAPKAGRNMRKSTPVGSYPANPWGLHDMHGNVWEWVQDAYEANYRCSPIDGGAWEGGSINRVLRGGSWLNSPQYLRCGNRNRSSIDFRVFNHGFRLARTVV